VAGERSKHQDRIIRSYYRNLDDIRTQRLSDLVGEVWLATTEKKKASLWARAAGLLVSGGMDADEAARIVRERDVEALAKAAERRSQGP
jgi:hypothetical protein